MGLNSDFPVKSTSMSEAHDQAVVVDNSTAIETLFRAIDDGDIDTAVDLARHSNADLSAVNSHGQNPIHLAISLGRDDIAAELVQASHENTDTAIHDTDRAGYTPLMLAMEYGNFSLARILIEMRAAVIVGRDTHCSPEKLTQKHRTIVHTTLLMEAQGDVAKAHKAAVAKGFHHFEKLIFGQHTALRDACERGDVDTAKALITKLGVDASFILTRTLLDQHPSVSPARANAVKTLIAADADLALALEYALEAGEMSAMQELVFLGAPGIEAMDKAIEKRDANAVALLSRSAVRRVEVLKKAAMRENVGAVQFMFRKDGGNLSKEIFGQSALRQLAKNGHIDAVKILIKENVNSEEPLIFLLKEGNKKAVNTMIAAGADAANVLQIIASTHSLAPIDETYQLKILIDAGVDPSRLLFEKVRGKSKDLHQAKILIAAGAKASASLAHAPERERGEILKTLVALSKEVSAIQKAVAGTTSGEDGAEVQAVGRILSAQRAMAQPELRDHRHAINRMADYFESRGNKDAATLLRALERVDWAEIAASAKNLSDANGAVSALMARNNFYSVRLLMSAGAAATTAVLYAIKNHDLAALTDLIDAGFDPKLVLWQVVCLGPADLARALIKEEELELVDLFKGLLDDHGTLDLKAFIPSITDGTDELLQACQRGETEVANALIAAGVNTGKVINLAIQGMHPQALRTLINLRADKAAALVEALESNQDTVAQMLLYLGADPIIARQKAETAGNKKAADLLKEMGVMLEKAAV